VTPEQREAILELLEEPGPSPIDAARMAHVPLNDFEQEWRRGRRDAENGQDSDAASFYLSSQSAMARVQARLVAEAHAASGSRESQDTLRLAEHVRGLAEPFADEEVGGIRSRSPMLNLTDRIEAESDPEERERMRAALRAGTEGLRAMFLEMQRQEARARESAA
jgi:hypothetical protein